MTVGELLRSQRRWGRTRARKFLFPLALNENRELGRLTERQRNVLAAELEAKRSGRHRLASALEGQAPASPAEGLALERNLTLSAERRRKILARKRAGGEHRGSHHDRDHSQGCRGRAGRAPPAPRARRRRQAGSVCER